MCTLRSVVRALLTVSLVASAADPGSGFRRMPGVRATIALSSNATQLGRGQGVSMSCLVTFPHMFALYEPYMMRWEKAIDAANDRWITLSSNGRLLGDVDERKYSVCYKRPDRFQYLLNYTLHIRDFSEKDEGEYRCEGIDNPEDPKWPLNTNVNTGHLTLAKHSDERHAVAGKAAKRARSCTAGGFVYRARSTSCVYYSERDIESGITVIAPCPTGTAFDVTACRCMEDAICWHGSMP